MGIDLRDTIASLGVAETVEVERPSSPTWTDGIQSANYSVLRLVMAVQPEKRSSKILPEGVRADDQIRVWCTTELRTANDPGGAGADRIRWKGKKWEVQEVDDWSSATFGEYYEALARMVRA